MHKQHTQRERPTNRPMDGWMAEWTNGRMNVDGVYIYVQKDIESEPFRCFYKVSTVWNMHKTETRAHKITGKKVPAHTHTLSFTFYNQAATAPTTKNNRKGTQTAAAANSGNEAEATTTKIIILYIYKIY